MYNECVLRGTVDVVCSDDIILTVEAQVVDEVCDDVIAAVNRLREVVAEQDTAPIEDRSDPLMEMEHTINGAYMYVQQAIAELTGAVVAYTEPDAGIESSE